MRTVRCSDRRGGGGVPAWGLYLPGQGCTCLGGVPAWVEVCIPACTEADTPPPRERND